MYEDSRSCVLVETTQLWESKFFKAFLIFPHDMPYMLGKVEVELQYSYFFKIFQKKEWSKKWQAKQLNNKPTQAALLTFHIKLYLLGANWISCHIFS